MIKYSELKLEMEAVIPCRFFLTNPVTLSNEDNIPLCLNGSTQMSYMRDNTGTRNEFTVISSLLIIFYTPQDQTI